jgi:hypothetical protein
MSADFSCFHWYISGMLSLDSEAIIVPQLLSALNQQIRVGMTGIAILHAMIWILALGFISNAEWLVPEAVQTERLLDWSFYHHGNKVLVWLIII